MDILNENCIKMTKMYKRGIKQLIFLHATPL